VAFTINFLLLMPDTLQSAVGDFVDAVLFD